MAGKHGGRRPNQTGRPHTQTPKKRRCITLSGDLDGDIKQMAENEGTSYSAMVEKLIKRGLKQ